MKRFILPFLFGIVCSVVVTCLWSFKAPDETEAAYSITRVYTDLVLDMKIYQVSTPRGAYYVMWESTKGGMCTLK